MILVDAIVEWPAWMVKGEAARYGRSWCHMVSDTSFEELHAFAAQIGMKHSWFQGDHYDLTPSRRQRALTAGAVEVLDRREFLSRWFGKGQRKK